MSRKSVKTQSQPDELTRDEWAFLLKHHAWQNATKRLNIIENIIRETNSDAQREAASQQYFRLWERRNAVQAMETEQFFSHIEANRIAARARRVTLEANVQYLKVVYGN